MADKLVVCKENIVKIQIGPGAVSKTNTTDTFYLIAGQTECEFTDEITSQDSAFKNTIWDVSTPTRHKATASVTCRRIADDPVQLHLLKTAENVGDDCRVQAEILSGDGAIRKGIFNVSISNAGVSGAAGDLADLVIDLNCATADGIDLTWDSNNTAYTTAAAELAAMKLGPVNPGTSSDH